MNAEIDAFIDRFNPVFWGAVKAKRGRPRKLPKVDARRSRSLQLFVAARKVGVWRKVYRRVWRQNRIEQRKKDLLNLHKITCA